MKGWVGYTLLAISLVVAFQGFGNVQQEEATEVLAKSVACDVDSQCILKAEFPEEIRTDIFQRKYQWRSSVGTVHSVCRREFVFFGGWSCRSEKGPM